ncbi:MAG TPA: hypothetical protein LFV92_02275 [Rickettsia endosymbiont of Ceroptres masudai]|nr:hypothetical protein [Rickettsia endosymbiont of Ceroptres masudai]
MSFLAKDIIAWLGFIVIASGQLRRPVKSTVSPRGLTGVVARLKKRPRCHTVA